MQILQIFFVLKFNEKTFYNLNLFKVGLSKNQKLPWSQPINHKVNKVMCFFNINTNNETMFSSNKRTHFSNFPESFIGTVFFLLCWHQHFNRKSIKQFSSFQKAIWPSNRNWACPTHPSNHRPTSRKVLWSARYALLLWWVVYQEHLIWVHDNSNSDSFEWLYFTSFINIFFKIFL